MNGKPQRIQHADWHAGKGLAFAQLKVGAEEVNVFLTHTVASYASLPDFHYDEYYQVSLCSKR